MWEHVLAASPFGVKKGRAFRARPELACPNRRQAGYSPFSRWARVPLVTLPSALVLLLRAKHLFVAAMVAGRVQTFVAYKGCYGVSAGLRLKLATDCCLPIKLAKARSPPSCDDDQ